MLILYCLLLVLGHIIILSYRRSERTDRYPYLGGKPILEELDKAPEQAVDKARVLGRMDDFHMLAKIRGDLGAGSSPAARVGWRRYIALLI